MVFKKTEPLKRKPRKRTLPLPKGKGGKRALPRKRAEPERKR